MDMAQRSEAETSGGLSSEVDYEVFLSFRGPDTRQGFTDCLYNHMLEANIRVFRDEEELHVGKRIADELPEAIKKSKIYVPIFSKGYASSAWCLRELAYMVECRESKPSEKEIMPIFYDVETDDVKLKSQLYVNALDEHEKKFGRDVRLKWENALKTVAKIKGWELKKQGYWNFIKSVVREIFMKLKTKDKYITKHLVGMEDLVEAIVNLLDVDSGGVSFLLIHGMGGIRKTTLAKIVFNKLYSHFDKYCFLENVRESSGSSLVNLQQKLLSKASGLAFETKIDSVDDGIEEIKKQLSNRNILIILDDVDDDEQLKKLAMEDISFGSGSRIIFTSRNVKIGKAYVNLKYEVNPLNDVQSLELFSRHAFRRDTPPEDYAELSRQAVPKIGGLPLALEVIGSLLHRENKSFWLTVLFKLGEISYPRLDNKLKISYDALTDKQKQIFLDIACLFVDKDKTNAFYMWEDCDFQPDYSVEVLVCMSLIKITADNKFWMHDQLQDLGRKIIRGDTMPIDPNKQSRLWDPEMANNIIGTKERKEAVEAISLNGQEEINMREELSSESYYRSPSYYELLCGELLYGDLQHEPSYVRYISRRQLSSEEFSGLPKLRFLRLYGGQLYGDFENQLSELRYMSWHDCPKELLATNFHPGKLVVLDLYDSDINADWAGWSQITVTKKLKVLDLTFNLNMTKTPDLSGYKSLERLILRNCWGLIEVDGSIEHLKCLVFFDAHGCTRLEQLPEGIGGLEKLEYLDLSGCKSLRKLPESLGGVASLVELDLSNMAITKLPNSIGNLKQLSILKVQSTEIDELPSSIGNLRKLKSLVLRKTKIKELPESIGNMESLLELDVSCTHCLQLPESIGHISTLKVIDIANSHMRDLPQSIVELNKLEKVRAGNCEHLKWAIPEGIWKLSLLRILILDHTLITNVPLTIKQLPCLEHLQLDYCSELEVLPELRTSLVSLSFGSSSLRWVPNLSNLTMLEELIYNGHEERRCPLFFQDGPCRESHGFLPPSVSKLTVRNNKISTSFSFRDNFRNLLELWIYKCSWREVQLDGLEQLVKLDVTKLKLLEGLAGLSGLKRLKRLRLSDCPKLTTIQGVGSLESLTSLEISQCDKIESLEVLGIKKLQSLFISECEELVTVEGLDELVSLNCLNFFKCRSLTSFPDAINSKIPDACHLTIRSCPNFEGYHFLAILGNSFGEYRSRYCSGRWWMENFL